MNIGEAVAHNLQLREDIALIPSEAVRDRYIAMAEQTPQYQEAKIVLAALVKLAPKFGDLIRSRQLQLKNIEPLKASTESRHEKETISVIKAIQDNYCEALPDSEIELVGESYADVTDLADKIFDDFRQLKLRSRRQAQHLGTKKAAKLINRENRLTENLINNLQINDTSVAHPVTKPDTFAVLSKTLVSRSIDKNLPTNERHEYRELSQKFLDNGMHYIAQHADELTKNKSFMKDLLITYAVEKNVLPYSLSTAEELFKSFMLTANTPERAVDRMEAIVQGVIDCYKYRAVLSPAVYRLLLMNNDFYKEVPFLENLVAAQSSYHKPDLATRASQLGQYVAFFYADNLNLDLQQYTLTMDELFDARDEPTNQALKRVFEEGQALDPKFNEKIEQEELDSNIIDYLLSQYGGLNEAAYRDYLERAKKQGPEFQRIFSTETELRQKYKLTIGQANLLGNPLTDTIVIDRDHSIDFLFKKTFADNEKRKIRADVICQSLATPSSEQPDKTVLEYIIDKIDADEASPVHHAGRLAIGSIAYLDEDGQLPTAAFNKTVFVRKRTLYDDEHSSPLTDFDVRGFETTRPLPELAEILDQIDKYKIRFVPKRGIEAVIADVAVKRSGLGKLVLRAVNLNRLAVEATIHDRGRLFQINNNRFYDKHGYPLDHESTPHASKFAAFCLSALAEWMCREKVKTNEGVVVEGSRNGPVKGGYFAYLPVRQSDGYKFKRDDAQWYLCAEEKGLDLDQESERLASLDPTGKNRNSTYVRIHPDDGVHLKPLKIYL